LIAAELRVIDMERQAQARGVPIAADWLLTALLSTTAGAVDVIGFLALGGLFTAHITGNLVVLAAHYVTGGYSQIGPLLSVPVFVAVLGIVTVLFTGKATRGTRRTLLMVHVALLAAFLGLGVGYGPFPNAESALAVFVGMVGVAAMATQNALVKLELRGLPSTAVVTTNTVQLTIDIAVLVRGQGDPEDLARARGRARLTLPAVGGFAAGCAAGAFLQMHFGLRALLLPVTLAATALLVDELRPTPEPL
jgi:uncharacterized membrane protein YoaK (UPF0700 family)